MAKGGSGTNVINDNSKGSGENITPKSTTPMELTQLLKNSSGDTYRTAQEAIDGVVAELNNNDFSKSTRDLELLSADLGKNKRIMGYNTGNQIAINENYLKSGMNEAYDDSVESGYHPSRGKYTGTQAVIFHEYGHKINDDISRATGRSFEDIAREVCVSSAKSLKLGKTSELSKAISGYAKGSNTETIAEAYADVRCNGANAKRESKAVYKELKKLYDKTVK